MTFQQIYCILRARTRVMVLLAILTGTGAVTAQALLPSTYKATSALILNYKGADPLTGHSAPGQSASGYLPTYLSTQMEIIKSPAVARMVVQRLGPQQLPSYRTWFRDPVAAPDAERATGIGERLLRRLQVKPARESSVIHITFSAADPDESARVANAFATEYRRFNAELEAAPAQAASRYFEGQLTLAGAALSSALANMARFQQVNGIVNQSASADVESLRLNELGTQLVGAQAALMEASSRRQQLARHAAGVSPDITNNPLVQALKIDLSKAKVKYQSLSRRFTPEHPTPLAVAAEITSIEKEIANQIAIAAQAVGHTAAILTQRERELRGAFEQQKSRMLDLNNTRTDLVMLTKQVESSQRAYDSIAQRLAQTRLQARSTQSDINLLGMAAVPTAPAGPGLPVALALGLLAGLAAGACVALAQELSDRRIRCATDLQSLFGLPVLTTLQAMAPVLESAQRRRRLALRTVS